MGDAKIPHPHLVNIYGCEFGEDCFVGPFVEIQNETKIGDRTRISSHTFICQGVEIGKDCFIGHGVMFVNDLYDSDSIQNWIKRTTKIGDRVRVGSNATILPVDIGDDVVIGAGAVVTKDVPSGSLIKGVPAK